MSGYEFAGLALGWLALGWTGAHVALRSWKAEFGDTDGAPFGVCVAMLLTGPIGLVMGCAIWSIVKIETHLSGRVRRTARAFWGVR